MIPMTWTRVDGRNVVGPLVVAPHERLSWPRTIGIGAQHVVAMFGATFLVPVLTGFPPATTLLFSGVGTMLFLVITGNRLPSYLGSSFSVIAPVIGGRRVATVTGSALGGLVAVGASLIVIGATVHVVGTHWLDVDAAAGGDRRDRRADRLQPGAAAKSQLREGAAGRVRHPGAAGGALAFFRGILGRLAIFRRSSSATCWHWGSARWTRRRSGRRHGWACRNSRPRRSHCRCCRCSCPR